MDSRPAEPSTPGRVAALTLGGLAVLAILATVAGLASTRLGASPDAGHRLTSLGLLAVCAAPLVALLGMGLLSVRRHPRSAGFALAAVILTLLGILASG